MDMKSTSLNDFFGKEVYIKQIMGHVFKEEEDSIIWLKARAELGMLDLISISKLRILANVLMSMLSMQR